jgi:hypothetical protein
MSVCWKVAGKSLEISLRNEPEMKLSKNISELLLISIFSAKFLNYAVVSASS